jgi:hypothetical protein
VVSRWAGVYRVKPWELPTRVKEVVVRFGSSLPSAVVNRPVDHSTRGALGALWPVRQTGGFRHVAAWYRFWRHRGVKGVRQTLSDVGAHVGAVEQGFPDRGSVRGRRYRSKHAFCLGQRLLGKEGVGSRIETGDAESHPQRLSERVVHHPRNTPQTSHTTAG